MEVTRIERKDEFTECVFCDIINGKQKSFEIVRTQHSIAFLSLEGHVLVVPLKHIEESNFDEGGLDFADTAELAYRLVPVVKRVYVVEAVNLTVNFGEDAGQEIKHLHFHLIPRVRGDGKVKYNIPLMDDNERAKIIGKFILENSEALK